MKFKNFVLLVSSFVIFLLLFSFSKTFASTEVLFDINEDTTWSLSGSPYIISSYILIDPGVVLNIEPGVVVKFNFDTGLIVDGKIYAQGTEVSPIYFTSIYDDSLGGDTNNDGEDTSPYKGDWDLIIIRNSSNQSVLNNIVQKYSENGLILYNGSFLNSTNFNSDAGISVFNSKSSFSNLNISNIELYEQSEVSINNSNILNEVGENILVLGGSSIYLKNAKISGYGDQIDIANNSSAVFENVKIFNNDFYPAISVFLDSHLLMSKSEIFGYNALEAYENSTITINDSSISCENNGIEVFNSSSLSFSNSEISCSNFSFQLFNNISTIIENSKIKDSTNGIIAFNNENLEAIKVFKTEIFNNGSGILTWNSGILANQNSIHDNLIGVETYPIKDIDFTNNWWGSLSGPYHQTTNLNGLGNPVSDNIIFDPWLSSDPLQECCSNIIFVPGFEGSRLYEKKDDDSFIQRWESGILSSTDIDSLFFNKLGDSIKNIFTGEVIERTNYTLDKFNANFYKSISTLFTESKSALLINDFFMFSYDWRYDIEDLALNGSRTKEGILKLKDEIIKLSQNSKTGKVSLIGHSNGGLFIKKTIQLLKETNQEELIDNVILIGSPQLGTPRGLGALLHGYETSLGYGFVLKPEKARSLAENLPGIYGLIPSKKYYEKIGPIISFDNSLNNNWTKLYGNTLDYSEQTNFLAGLDGRKKPTYDDLKVPAILNNSLITKANNLHNNIDDLEIPDNINFYEIAGVGVPTLQSFSYESRLLGIIPVDYKTNLSCDGDSTVVSQSAVDINTNANYLNLYSYRKDTEEKFSHSSLVENPEILNLISNIITKTDKPTPHITKENPDLSGCKFKVLGIFSPADLDVYDSQGRHTGINKDYSNSDFIVFDTEIPHSDFFIIGDQKYAIIPDEGVYTAKIDGTGNGVFTLNVATQENDVIIDNFSYDNISVNQRLKAEVSIDSNLPNYPTLSIDSNGDGRVDSKIYPNNQEDLLLSLEKIRQIIIELNLPKNLEKQLLQKIEKILKIVTKEKNYHKGKLINKFIKNVELNKKLKKKMSQKDYNNLVEEIKNILDNL